MGFPSKTNGEQPGKREQHGAVKRSNCNDMERRFKSEGRKVDLADIKRNNLGTGGVLDWICVFEGEDAEPGYYSRYDENWSSKK